MIENLIQEYLLQNNQNSLSSLFEYLKNNKLYSLGIILALYFSKNNKDVLPILADFYLLNNDNYNSFLIYDQLNSNKDLIKVIPKIINNFNYYNPKIIQNIIPNLDSQITFSITTCKRFDLFCQSINSFINCCTDIHLVNEWILVDDNSSEQDRQKMQELYPFFTFIFKNPDEKGHPTSMNIIKDRCKTEYLFHMEDDWLFFKQDNYLTKCKTILDNSEYGQILINKNYAEVENDIEYIGGIQKNVEDIIFFEHQYLMEDSEELKIFLKDYDLKNKTYNAVYYWPHFSFRPSLINTKIFKYCGEFKKDVFHFEREYANIYSQKYKSAFLPNMSCYHIGRLTTQISTKEVENAYDLNNTIQYKNSSMEIDYKNISTYVVNLDRRPDRWLNFIKTNDDKIKFLDYKRYSAVDGNKLKNSRQLQMLFNNNTYNWNAGMIGCALSHIDLWINFLGNKDKEILIIFEDDVKIIDNFKFYLNNILKNLKIDNWNLIFLGHHQTGMQSNSDFNLKVWNKDVIFNETLGGTFGYIINKNGCRKILNFIENEGMINCIDTMMLRSVYLDTMIWVAEPNLVYSTCYQFDKNSDTDIQYSKKRIYENYKNRLKTELDLFKKLNINFDGKDRVNSITIYKNNEYNSIPLFKDNIRYFIEDKYCIEVPLKFSFNLNLSKLKRKGRWNISEII
jgi:GR25 family glycosyltransferase involved in LPS biosynthesis